MAQSTKERLVYHVVPNSSGERWVVSQENAEFRMARQRGEIFEGTSWAPWVMATYHPSALLRIPDETAREEARRQFLADLGKVLGPGMNARAKNSAG